MYNKNENKILEGISSMMPKGRILNKNPNLKDLRLEKDLGIYGDDAWFLIINFFNKFNVNNDNFNLSSYFSDEPTLVSWIFRRKKKKGVNYKDIVIDSLACCKKRFIRRYYYVWTVILNKLHDTIVW